MIVRNPFLIALYFSLVVLAVSCNKDDHQNTEKSNQNLDENKIVFKGSDTELSLVTDLVNTFAPRNSGFTFEVTGGGSVAGIEDFINSKINVLNTSRALYSDEIELAKKRGLDVKPMIFGLDAIAIITPNKLGIDSLSLFQLRDIYSGRITNWKQVGGPDIDIQLFGRNPTSGTYAYMLERVVQGQYSEKMTELETNQEIVDAIINSKNGIGYVGAGFLMDSNGKPRNDLWAVYIYIEGDHCYSPYEMEAVKNGDYPLTRPLYHYINGVPSNVLHDFFKFELSVEGQSIVRRHGYFPVSDYYMQINRSNGIATR
jgi:phosphate transport system substrate-binding protein